MWIKIVEIIVLCGYLAINFLTAKLMTAKQMKEEFVTDQCTVGKVFANLFYAPAWVLKGLRAAALKLIA